MTVDDIFKYSGGTTMNQGKEYKNGALMGAIAAIFTLGLGVYAITNGRGLYIVAGTMKHMKGLVEFSCIATLVCLLLAATFAFANLNKASVGCLATSLIFSSIGYIKYFDIYKEAMESLFSSKRESSFTYTLWLIKYSFESYLTFVIALLLIILFILCFTTPDRGGVVAGIIVFAVILFTISLAGTISYFIEAGKMTYKPENYVMNSILEAAESVFALLTVIGISKSVAQDDVRMYGQSRITPNNGMYGIPYSQRPQQSSQFGFGTGMNAYNTPQNPAYDQRGSFNQRATFGGQPNMNGFGQPQMGGYGQQQMNNFGQPNIGGYNQNMNYNQPQNMGNFGQPNMNGFGQSQNMGNFGGFGQPQMGGNNQTVGGFNPNMNYNQPKNTADFGGFGQPDNSFGSQPVDKPTKIEEPVAPKSEPKEVEPVSQVQDTSIYDKPDNSVEFEQPQSFTSTDL